MFIDTNARTDCAPAERNDLDKAYFECTPLRSSGAQSLLGNPGSINIASLRDEGIRRVMPQGRSIDYWFPVGSYQKFAQLVAVLICAVALKWHYSTASVNELRWILAPTATLVELISGTRFAFESYTGYMSSDHTFVIAASCAGVNFLITAFLMLSLGKIWRGRSEEISWRFFVIAAASSYLATLVANTVRISSSLLMRGTHLEIGLSANQLHRFEGIFVYFGFLLLLCLVSERMSESLSLGEVHSSTRGFIRQSFFPLLIYYATTLGMPLANGAYRQGADFVEHALFVLVTPILVILPLAVFRFLKSFEWVCSSLQLNLFSPRSGRLKVAQHFSAGTCATRKGSP